MGNNQSNTIESKILRGELGRVKRKKNAKIYEIIQKQENTTFIRFYLDKGVVYKDGNYKYMDFSNRAPLSELKEGRRLILDLDETNKYSSSKTFSVDDACKV